MRRVLLLAYYFPPSVDAGAKRALGFFRHLPAHGWEPTVLTVADGNYATAGDTAAPDPPGVVRVAERRYPWQRGAPAGRAQGDAARGAAPGLLRRLVHEALYVPDAWRGFHAPALAAARRLHAERPFDAVWTTSSPWTLLRTGAALRRDGLPWVADLRDLWTDNHFGHPHGALRRAFDRALERRWLGAAAAVTVATAGLAERLAARGVVPRADVVPNGFLADDASVRAAADAARPAGATTRIVFTGKLYDHAGHSVTPFLDALVRLRETAPHAAARLRADFYGRVPPSFRGDVDRRGLADVVAFHGLLPAEAAAAQQRAADGLLALVPDGRPEVALTKVYDYVAAWAPVLVIGPPDGAAAAAVAEAGAGRTCAPADVDGIAGWLRTLAEGPRESAEERRARLPRVLAMSCAARAVALAAVLDRVAR